MKAKLSAISLALLPLVASASATTTPAVKSADGYKNNSVIVVYKQHARAADKAAARNAELEKGSKVSSYRSRCTIITETPLPS